MLMHLIVLARIVHFVHFVFVIVVCSFSMQYPAASLPMWLCLSWLRLWWVCVLFFYRAQDYKQKITHVLFSVCYFSGDVFCFICSAYAYEHAIGISLHCYGGSRRAAVQLLPPLVWRHLSGQRPVQHPFPLSCPQTSTRETHDPLILKCLSIKTWLITHNGTFSDADKWWKKFIWGPQWTLLGLKHKTIRN